MCLCEWETNEMNLRIAAAFDLREVFRPQCRNGETRENLSSRVTFLSLGESKVIRICRTE